MIITCPHCSRESEHVTEIRKGPLVIDLGTAWAKRERAGAPLTSVELRVLTALARADDGLSRAELEGRVWPDAPARSENCIPNAIMRLRDKLKHLRVEIPKLTPNTDFRYRLLVQP